VALALALWSAAPGAQWSDAVSEARWQQARERRPGQGEVVRLGAGGSAAYSALYRPAASADEAQGGVVILHDAGAHPDWPQVVTPLAGGLPRYGWHTLTPQMPRLRPGQGSERYGPLVDQAFGRIDAALDWLEGRGVLNRVLVGHGLGAAVAAAYPAEHPDAGVAAVVLVGVGTYGPLPERLDPAQALGRIQVPVLDLYGEHDLSVTLAGARDRSVAARKIGADYSRVVTPGAGHGFRDQGPALVKRVRGWLARHAAGTELDAPRPP
jgi:pimeloyl-ACP methyl ester carboxylesterase